MSVLKDVQDVTEQIAARSAAARRDYLRQIDERRHTHPLRECQRLTLRGRSHAEIHVDWMVHRLHVLNGPSACIRND